MSRYQEWLKTHIQEHPDFIRPDRYRTEALALLDSGVLDDLCISRPKSRLTWGIELPFDPQYVCYVWFDSLLAYTTALGGMHSPDFDRFWPHAEHLVAKDIRKPPAVFWPTMLKAAGLPIYKHLNVHGYWLSRDTKMSKSLGNVVATLEMANRYGIDALRYFLLRDMHLGSDGSFSEEALVGRINADLANDLGNLFSRVLSMTARFNAGRTPAPGPDTEREQALKALAADSLANFQNLFANVRFSTALESLWELIRALNKYVDAAAPWALAKTGDSPRLGTVLYTLLECMRKVALHLWPVMPGKAMQMLRQLGREEDAGLEPEQGALLSEILQFGLLKPGTPVAAASNLFPRIEAEEAAPVKKKKDENRKTPLATASSGPGQIPAGPAEPPARIGLSDFQKMDIRIGTVVECERHPQADTLLRVMVDVGEEKPRQILAGLAEFLSPEELPGRQVTVLVNLAPRKMRGLESQGMILTVRTEKGMELLAPAKGVPPGSKISLWELNQGLRT